MFPALSEEIELGILLAMPAITLLVSLLWAAIRDRKAAKRLERG